MEEALNIHDSPSPPSPAKSSRKVPRKPRFVAPPVSQRKIVPKIVLDEGTPRKFFKSKMSDTAKPEALADGFKTPAKSLKSLSNFEIYDEDKVKTPRSTKSKLSGDSIRTPAPASIRKPGRGSVRKVTKEDGDEETVATPATSSTRRRGRAPKAAREESDEEVFATPVTASIRKPGRTKSTRKASEENQPDENFVTPTPVSVSASARRPRSSTNRKKDEGPGEEERKSTRKKKEEEEVPSQPTRSSTRLRRI